jgi:PIN domain nuclease of toxin-antitoxin system
VQLLLRRAVVSSVNAAEVLAKLAQKGMSREAAAAAVAALHVDVVPFDYEDAQASAQYVGRNVSLGDRCFLAAAARYGEGFTSDRQLCEFSARAKVHRFGP